jgi:hypothetical protein
MTESEKSIERIEYVIEIKNEAEYLYKRLIKLLDKMEDDHLNRFDREELEHE